MPTRIETDRQLLVEGNNEKNFFQHFCQHLSLTGDEQNGMLETLLCRTFADDPESGCIDEFFKCLETEANQSLKRPDKSRAYAFLSTKEHPQSSVGVAAQKGYWNLDHDAFIHVRDFLIELAS